MNVDTNRSEVEIFIVEDDKTLGIAIKKYLEKIFNLPVRYYLSPSELLSDISSDNQKNIPFCLVTDITFDESGADGLLLIDILKERNLNFVSIAMTGFASVQTAISATKKGVYHYLTKPFQLDVLANLIRDEVKIKLGFDIVSDVEIGKISRVSAFTSKFKIESPKEEDIYQGMIGRSQIMQDVFNRIKKVAQSDSTVLITGESGTGKELVADAIHQLSNRVNKKMVSVNCGAIPGDLLESELFGHVKGAFTGAISNRKGRFETANKGTLFLDEIGDMPLLLQVKILRALQTREVELIGSNDLVKIDVRIITATHRNLEKAVLNGDFREDLFYRLNVIPFKIPPLKERKEDIPLMISYFLSKFVSADGRNHLEFSDDALDCLISYPWPGNVRELENLIERLVILKGGSILNVSDLPAKFFQHWGEKTYKNLVDLPDVGLDLKDLLSEVENSLIFQALDRTNGNKNRASKLLQINRTTLIEKMKKKGLIFS